MRTTRNIEPIRKPTERLGKNCRNVTQAQERSRGDLGRRGEPIEEDREFEKAPVVAKGRSK